MRLYNTLTKKVEEFIPNDENIIRMYTCGPTVYHYAHIGNIRSYILEDLFEKTFNYLGYNVKRVMNITDVGHLQSDGDTGEDKMSIASKREHKSSHEIADYYTKAFFDDCSLVNVNRPEIVSKATDNIDEYIKIISKLLKEKRAYISNGNIYFDTSKDLNYYELSGRNAEDLLVAVRDDIDVDEDKKNPFDFGLWFTNSKFSNQELQWDSPWGKGYPGWHIECSAIAIKYLGEYLDIHMGAEDAIFPHHTNEIAQSEAFLGHKWCNYWIHLSFLNINNNKMSKSKGDILRIKDLKEIGYDPLSFRLFVLNTYYHKQVNFTFDALKSCDVSLRKLRDKISNLIDKKSIDNDEFTKWNNKFKSYVSDDLNTANAITLLYDLLKSNVSDSTKIALIKSWDTIFSLDLFKQTKIQNDDQEILDMIEKRDLAKKNKDYILADSIRNELLLKGIKLIDTRDGTMYELI